jgi:phosphatidylinositol alpha-1,6-mannosyltransferase
MFPPHAGGSRYYYYNLMRRIAAMDCDVTVLTKKVPGWEDFDRREQTATFHIRRQFKPISETTYPIPLKIAILLAGGLCSSLSIASTSALRRANVLHCGDLYPQGTQGLLLKKAFGLPFVAYAHGEEITLHGSYRYQPKLRDLIYQSADAVVANSDFSVEQLRQIGIDRAKIHKITPGLDTAVFYPAPADPELRDRYGLNDHLTLLTVGRLVPRKAQDQVIHALAELGGEAAGVKYLIVGVGPEEPKLRQLAADLQVSSQVIFAGYVPDAELNRYYNLADVFVMPNRVVAGDLEGFGMVFLEANAAGKPVVAGRSGGAGEAVEHGKTGLLVDPEDRGQLLCALRTLIKSPEVRRQMGAQGLQRVCAEFDWNSRAQRLQEISGEVVRRRPSR